MFISCLSVQLHERGRVCVLMMCGCACKHQREKKDEARSKPLHPFYFAAKVIHLSDHNCYQFVIALSQSGFRPHSDTQTHFGDLVTGEGDWTLPLVLKQFCYIKIFTFLSLKNMKISKTFIPFIEILCIPYLLQNIIMYCFRRKKTCLFTEHFSFSLKWPDIICLLTFERKWHSPEFYKMTAKLVLFP